MLQALLTWTLLVLIVAWLAGPVPAHASTYDERCHGVHGGVCVDKDLCGGAPLASCANPPRSVCCARGNVLSSAGYAAGEQWLYHADGTRTNEAWGSLWTLPVDTDYDGTLLAVWPDLYGTAAARGIRELAVAVLPPGDLAAPVVDAANGGLVVPGQPHAAFTEAGRLPLLLNLTAMGAPPLPCFEDPPTTLDLAVHVLQPAPDSGPDLFPLTAGEHWAHCRDPFLLDVPPGCRNETLAVRTVAGYQRYGQRCFQARTCPGLCAFQAASDVSAGVCTSESTCGGIGGRPHPTAAAECGVPERCGRPVCCLPPTPGVQRLLAGTPPPPSSPPPVSAPVSPPAAPSPRASAVLPSGAPPAPSAAVVDEPAYAFSGRSLAIWLLLALLLCLAPCCCVFVARRARDRRIRRLVHAPVVGSAVFGGGASWSEEEDDEDEGVGDFTVIARGIEASSDDMELEDLTFDDRFDDADDDEWRQLEDLASSDPTLPPRRQ